jgi:5-methyltetrahydropteroyltriglutamate--homocysteine methyltransferase
MQPTPLRTTVIGSYPFPSWLIFASDHIEQFGPTDILEMQDDAVTIAVKDQIAAGLDVITDGEQSRFDFNLSFYAYIAGIDMETRTKRVWGPPAHDQRGKHEIIDVLDVPNGFGAVREYDRLLSLSPENGPTLKASLPGPYTLSGRILPNKDYPDRWAITEALLPHVRQELIDLVEAGCTEVTVDEPSMSCYGYREDTKRFVDIFNRTVEGIVGKCRLSTHLCFGNFKGHAVSLRRYAPLFPDFLSLDVDEIHLEMASREFSEIEMIEEIAKKKDVSIGVIDVKSYFIESPEHIAESVRRCLKYTNPERLSFSPDCGLSQTARWATEEKLVNMVEGVHIVRKELGLPI